MLILSVDSGLEDGLSEKVAVLIDEDNSVRIAANTKDFHRIFTDPEEFKHYVLRTVLQISEEIELAAN